ncbi:hypothetical protein GCM10029964_066480 [Kibdelosporangium lantanae]
MDKTLDRTPGLSARLKLTLSYAGFLMLAGLLMLVMVWFFLLRYIPDDNVVQTPEGSLPGRRSWSGPPARCWAWRCCSSWCSA